MSCAGVASLAPLSLATALRISGNERGAVGAERLAAALDRNQTLTTFDIAGNEIGALGAERLAATLERNTPAPPSP